MKKKRTKQRWWYTRCPSCGEYGITSFWKIFQPETFDCKYCKKQFHCNSEQDICICLCSIMFLQAARRLFEAYVWSDCPFWLWWLLALVVILVYNRIAPLDEYETVDEKFRWWYTRCPHCKQKGIALFLRLGPRIGKKITSCHCCGHIFQLSGLKVNFLTVFVVFGVFFVFCLLHALIPVSLPKWMFISILLLAMYLWLRFGVPLDDYEEDQDDREWF